MKKRSLVAAIAMLVVSAIVLTSSTYAWFAASTTASIGQVTADVGNSAGAVYVSADSSTWSSSVTKDQLASAGGTFPAALTPVSYNSPSDQWFTGSIGNTEARTLTATASSSVPNTAIHYTFYVYVDAPGTVTISPTWTRGANYVYAYILADSTKTLYGGAAPSGTGDDSYKPITAAGTANDTSPADGIISDTEAGSGTLTVASTAVTAPATAATTPSLTFSSSQTGAANAKAVEVVVWAEGQDSNCFGIVAAAQAQLSWTLNYTAA